MAPNKMPFKSHLGHLFHPLSRKSSQTDSSPGSTTTDKPLSTGRSKTASSCELFGIIKALAAGGGDAHDHDDLDTPGSLDMDSGDEREALENQMRDALAESDDRDILSSKFTALSMDNMEHSGSAYPQPKANRPVLPQSESYKVAESPGAMSEVSTPMRHGDEELSYQGPPVSDEEKVQAIIKEFGDMTSLMEPPTGAAEPEAERMLAECMGSLFKGIMLIGNLHLTTHRLLFHAQLPPESKGTDATAADVLQSGPVTVHRHAALRPARRLWMEISSEMITTYPSGDESGRVRPLKTILLTSVHRVEPFDPENPCDFRINYATTHLGSRELLFSVDTEQSAVKWRKSIEGALFRHARHRWSENMSKSGEYITDEEGWTTMRCCIPLDRVSIKGASDYHNFVTLVGLNITLGNDHVDSVVNEDLSGHVGEPKQHDSGAHHEHKSHRLLHRPKKQSTQYIDTVLPSHSTNAGGEETPTTRYIAEPDGNSYNFNLALLNDKAWFNEALQAAVAAAHERSFKPDVVRPKMKFEIAGFDCLAPDDETDPTRNSNSSEDVDGEAEGDAEAEEESGGHSMTKGMRKAETAAMAAKMFGLREDEPIYLKRCYVVQGLVPMRGHVIITRKFICFWRRAAVGDDIKYRFSTSDIKGAEQAPTLRAGFSGMALKIHGQHDLKFEFWLKHSRNEVIAHIQSAIEAPDTDEEETPIERVESPMPIQTHAADILVPSRDTLSKARAFPDEATVYLPFIANRPETSGVTLSPRHFACLTIGSRGDVQPYIALGLRLKKDGHKVTIITHPEFKEWIESYDIGHREAGGDPTALMKLSAEHKMFSPGFFKESLGGFRQWLDDLLVDSWHACEDVDVLIESPSTMSGIHIAEALKIPYFRAFTMPWTRTNAYPQAFMVPAFEMGPSFNYSTYVLFDNIIWRASSGQINRWRKKYLDLPATDQSTLSVSKVPFLYNFSSAVVPKPLDWNDDITITGYWNLEDSDADWSPPEELETFMAKAKEDKRKLVYIGFGSIVVPHPNEVTRSIIAAVEKADVRAIIAKGWSSRGGEDEGPEVEFPDYCYNLDKVPHGWLFPKIDAAMHHGGAGTVGASLRAGLPTLIKPWFGDQHFWAVRVTKLEVGLKVASLKTEDLAAALIKATTDTVMIEKAARVGSKIRAENGVDNALQAIHYNIIRAGTDRTNL